MPAIKPTIEAPHPQSTDPQSIVRVVLASSSVRMQCVALVGLVLAVSVSLLMSEMPPIVKAGQLGAILSLLWLAAQVGASALAAQAKVTTTVLLSEMQELEHEMCERDEQAETAMKILCSEVRNQELEADEIITARAHEHYLVSSRDFATRARCAPTVCSLSPARDALRYVCAELL